MKDKILDTNSKHETMTEIKILQLKAKKNILKTGSLYQVLSLENFKTATKQTFNGASVIPKSSRLGNLELDPT